jgi:GDPmannose 4,6-dehydratase
MLQQAEPDDFVIATGEQHSVREFVGRAARELGMEIEWRRQGLDERGSTRLPVGWCRRPRYFRPTEVDALLGIPASPDQAAGGGQRGRARQGDGA